MHSACSANTEGKFSMFRFQEFALWNGLYHFLKMSALFSDCLFQSICHPSLTVFNVQRAVHRPPPMQAALHWLVTGHDPGLAAASTVSDREP